VRAGAPDGAFASRPATADRLALLPVLIVVGAVCFNAGLAIVNGNVAGLTQAPVVAAEIMFVALAHAMALANYRREMAPWYALLGLFAAFAVISPVLGSGKRRFPVRARPQTRLEPSTASIRLGDPAEA